jgi:hypothetical protein
MGKLISSIKLSETITINEYTDGVYLWDKTRGMNVAMYAKTHQDALVQALTYYQRRLKEVEGAYSDMKTKVDTFVNQFTDEPDD